MTSKLEQHVVMDDHILKISNDHNKNYLKEVLECNEHDDVLYALYEFHNIYKKSTEKIKNEFHKKYPNFNINVSDFILHAGVHNIVGGSYSKILEFLNKVEDVEEAYRNNGYDVHHISLQLSLNKNIDINDIYKYYEKIIFDDKDNHHTNRLIFRNLLKRDDVNEEIISLLANRTNNIIMEFKFLEELLNVPSMTLEKFKLIEKHSNINNLKSNFLSEDINYNDYSHYETQITSYDKDLSKAYNHKKSNLLKNKELLKYILDKFDFDKIHLDKIFLAITEQNGFDENKKINNEILDMFLEKINYDIRKFEQKSSIKYFLYNLEYYDLKSLNKTIITNDFPLYLQSKYNKKDTLRFLKMYSNICFIESDESKTYKHNINVLFNLGHKDLLMKDLIEENDSSMLEVLDKLIKNQKNDLTESNRPIKKRKF